MTPPGLARPDPARYAFPHPTPTPTPTPTHCNANAIPLTLTLTNTTLLHYRHQRTATRHVQAYQDAYLELADKKQRMINKARARAAHSKPVRVVPFSFLF